MGKQWVGVVLGVVVGACLAGGAILMLTRDGSDKRASAKPKGSTTDAPREVKLSSGARVEFLLLRPLHSGDADVGETATVVVTKDVKGADGAVAIPVGTTAEIEVVRSREASVMSQMISQPARLEVAFKPIQLGNATIELCAEEGDPDSTLEITRDTAGRDEASEALKALWEHPETQTFLTKLADRLNGDDTGEDFDDPDSKRIMKDVAAQLGLTATAKAMKDDAQSVGAMLVATERVSSGQFESMDAADTILAFQAVTELARVANGVDRGLRDKIKGRNIKAPIGTRLVGYVVAGVTLRR